MEYAVRGKYRISNLSRVEWDEDIRRGSASVAQPARNSNEPECVAALTQNMHTKFKYMKMEIDNEYE